VTLSSPYADSTAQPLDSLSEETEVSRNKENHSHMIVNPSCWSMQHDTFTLNPTGATAIGMKGSEETEKSLKDHQECKKIKQLRNSEKSKT
jgi:hypothetical protein